MRAIPDRWCGTGPPRGPRPAASLWLLCAALLAVGCPSDGADGAPGLAAVPATPTVLAPHQDAPGVNVVIVSVTGTSGLGGTFEVGDSIAVTYRLLHDDGSRWNLSEMAFGRAMFAGPTFNYQRVIPERAEVVVASSQNLDGSYTYTFPVGIPAAYAPPYHDTPSFGAADGELTSQPLLAGTYTVGMSFGWLYSVGVSSFLDVGEATRDVLFGGATTLSPRAVAGRDNCNQCHVELRAHDAQRRDLLQCLMCHTSGAEDLNDPAIQGGTPGVSIESRVLFHRIHNARHLPSVVGVGVLPGGALDYTLPPQPLVFVGEDGSAHDFSDVGFPVWPSRTQPAIKDFGYSSLAVEARAKEDLIRTGITSCFVCHGDPDGDGPLGAPAQGQLIFAQSTRRACGACHDDVQWDLPYVTNGQTMPAQTNDSQCFECHGRGAALSPELAHRHPLQIPFNNPGLDLDLVAVFESGANNGNGTVDVGEHIGIRFTLTDDMGLDVDPATLDEMRAVVSGPTRNLQLVLDTAIPLAALSGPQPFELDLPERRALEFVGDATAALGDVFPTSGRPHLNLPGATTRVEVRTATRPGATGLLADAAAPQNFIDVVDPGGFARNDYLVLEDGTPGREEYLRIQFVEGSRLWFSSPNTPGYAPGLRLDHSVGDEVREVTLSELVEGVDYALDASLGLVTELVEFGAGNAVLVSYTTSFEMPSTYPLALNASPELDQSWGGWSGKDLAPGTYTLGLSATRQINVPFAGEANLYSVSAPTTRLEFLVADASLLEPYALVSSSQNCNACHQDIQFHAGRYRGFDACILCHGTAASEDLPVYVAANAPPTPGVTANFRTMLHAMHHGPLLSEPYTVVGSGPAPYPDNFTPKTFETIFFPALPGGTLRCARCHGDGNVAWQVPAPRDHPTQQDVPIRTWRAVCATCHDSLATAAHLEANTASGIESCVICHGAGQTFGVELVHRPR